MRTKTICKALALAMLMPAMLLTTACSNVDDPVVNNDNTAKKGFTIPVTVNVTREGDKATTRATYDDDTMKLDFSEGDKLFVRGAGSRTTGIYPPIESVEFAGTLDYVSDGIFSGTVSTDFEYTGTADNFFNYMKSYYTLYCGMEATLLPNDYESIGYLSVSKNGQYDYLSYISTDYTKAIADSKAAGVEQLSYEHAEKYDGGFALTPQNAILSFTITKFSAEKEIAVSFTDANSNVISKNVTTDASGTATFAIGLEDNTDLNDCSLTVGDNDITLVSDSKTLEAGKIYNITRSGYKMAAYATAYNKGMLICTDGHIHAYNADAGCTATRVAKICYVGSDNGEAAPYNHGLALALSDANGGNTCKWKTSNTDAGHTKQNNENFTSESGLQYNDATHNSDTYPAFKAAMANNGTAAPTGCSAWFLPTGYQWNQMITGSTNYSTLRTNANLQPDFYWSSTEWASHYAWSFYFRYGGWGRDSEHFDLYVRACLAF